MFGAHLERRDYSPRMATDILLSSLRAGIANDAISLED